MAASKQASIHMHVRNAVTLVWGLLRLAPKTGLQIVSLLNWRTEEGEQIFFRVGPNISQLFWNIRSRRNVFYWGPNLMWHALAHTPSPQRLSGHDCPILLAASALIMTARQLLVLTILYYCICRETQCLDPSNCQLFTFLYRSYAKHCSFAVFRAL